MFGTLGGPEIFLILVIALIVFGPRKLPEIGQSMGKMLREFRKASTEFKRTVEDEIESDSIRQSTPQIQAPTGEPPIASQQASAEPSAPVEEPADSEPSQPSTGSSD